MNRWKKVTAGAVALIITAGASAAWAQGPADNAPTGTPPPATTRALGGATPENIFTAITPCRLVDTRAAGGRFAVGAQRSYDVRGTGGTFAAQGGLTNGCGIPAAASAVEITVTAAEASGKGFVRVFPASMPNATFLNSTQTFNASNTGTVALCTGICPLNSDVRVKNFASTTEIIIDVQGYYQQQMAAQVEGNGTLGRNSRAVSVSVAATGTYRVRFDRDVRGCAYNATVGTAAVGTAPGFATAQPQASQPSGVFVQTFNTSGAPTDLPFYVTVTC